MLLGGHSGFRQEGEGWMAMLFQGRPSFLRGGGLTTGEGGGFLSAPSGI